MIRRTDANRQLFFHERHRLNAQAAAVAIQLELPLAVPCNGTLLGMVRDRSVIAHDNDVDFCLLPNDWPDGWPKYLGGVWKRFQLETVYHHFAQPSQVVYRHAATGIKVDILRLFEDERERWWAQWSDEWPQVDTVVRSFPRIVTESFTPLKLFNCAFRVPQFADVWLEQIYGAAWRRPDPYFSYHA